MGDRRLVDASSFIRDVGSSCSSILFESDTVIVGSKEGAIKSWSIETGKQILGLDMEGPISDLAVSGEVLFASCSSKLVAVKIRTGEVLWSSQLEGSSDSVAIWDGFIWALSSVYEIDISDYTESTLWKFDSHGELIERWSFAEKGWHMGVNNGIEIGIGRPSCGFIKVGRDGILNYHSLAVPSPVTIGCDGAETIIFGLSDGSICNSEGELWQKGSGLVTSIIGIEDGWASGDRDGRILWGEKEIELNSEVLTMGVAPNGVDLWVQTWDEKTRFLSISPAGVYSHIFEHPERIVVCGFKEDAIVFGDEDGRVFLVEKRYENRFAEGDIELGDREGERSLLMERLRRLRE
ncbi:MAG: PQQ-binding-like beta-propeller repeat protein [Candidatus Thalassarchaeaceae archaeon]